MTEPQPLHESTTEEIDLVNAPPHYRQHPSGVECIDIVEHFGYNLGNAVKYIWRQGLKTSDGTEDLNKAIWYIRRELARREKSRIPPTPKPL